jgi:hypothetical protein
LRWIIEHDEEYFREWQIYKSAISSTRKNRHTFSLLFGHLVDFLKEKEVQPDIMHDIPVRQNWKV